jgi:hypothetical protein
MAVTGKRLDKFLYFAVRIVLSVLRHLMDAIASHSTKASGALQ